MTDQVIIDVLPSGPVQFVLAEGASREHMYAARKLIGAMRSIYNIDQRAANGETNIFHSHKAVMRDGSFVKVTHNNGQDVVHITPPPEHISPPISIPAPPDAPQPAVPSPEFAEHVFPPIIEPEAKKEEEEEPEEEPGGIMYCAGSGVTVAVDIRTGRRLKQFSNLDAEYDDLYFALSPDGTRLYRVKLNSAKLEVFNTETEELVAVVTVSSIPFTSVWSPMVSPDGRYVYVLLDWISDETFEYSKCVKIERSFDEVSGAELYTVIATLEFKPFFPEGYIWDEGPPEDPWFRGDSNTWGIESPPSVLLGQITIDGSKIYAHDSGRIARVYPPLYDTAYTVSKYAQSYGVYVIDTASMTYSMAAFPPGPYFTLYPHTARPVRSADGTKMYVRTGAQNAVYGSDNPTEFDPSAFWPGVPEYYWGIPIGSSDIVSAAESFPYPFVDEFDFIGYEVSNNGKFSYVVKDTSIGIEVYKGANGSGPLKKIVMVSALATNDDGSIFYDANGNVDEYTFPPRQIILVDGRPGVGPVPLTVSPTVPASYEAKSGVFSPWTDVSYPLNAHSIQERRFQIRIRESTVTESGVTASPTQPRLYFEMFTDYGSQVLKLPFGVTTPPDVYRYTNNLASPPFESNRSHVTTGIQPFFDTSVVAEVDGTVGAARGLQIYFMQLFANSGPPNFPGDVATSSEVKFWARLNDPYVAETNTPSTFPTPLDPAVVEATPDTTLMMYPNILYDLVFYDPEDPTSFSVGE